MSYSQSQINSIVDEIVSQYEGQRITYFGSFAGDSIAPIAYYVDRLRGTSPPPPMANNRADGWGVDFPPALMPFFSHEIYQTDKHYPKGTILIWDTPHIAINIKSDGTNTVKVFEQSNDSPCGITDRIVDDQQNTCMYALVPLGIKSPPPRALPKGVPKMPIKDKKYYVCKSILGFSAYSNALKHKDATGAVSQGNYYVFRESYGMINITKLQGYAGYWINPADNVL
jgi:hypothetical protein